MQKRRSIREIEGLFPKIKSYLQEVFGERLGSVILYGSFAKNRANKNSDIDIAVILKENGEISAELKAVNNFISDLGLEYNELITILPLSLTEVENSRWPLYQSLREEGLRL